MLLSLDFWSLNCRGEEFGAPLECGMTSKDLLWLLKTRPPQRVDTEVRSVTATTRDHAKRQIK